MRRVHAGSMRASVPGEALPLDVADMIQFQTVGDGSKGFHPRKPMSHPVVEMTVPTPDLRP